MWKGPEEGLSQSLINRFLTCPFRFYIYAIKGLEDDRPYNINLIWGNAFHVGLEKIFEYYLKFRSDDTNPSSEALLYATPYILEDLEKMSESTQIPSTVFHSIINMLAIYPLPQETGYIEPEQVFSFPVELPSGRIVTFRGKVDGLGPTTLIEHKCKGKFESLQTLKETPFDLQTNLYCWIMGRNKVIYDLIRIPEAQYTFPVCPQREQPKDFIYRLFHNHKAKNFPIRFYKRYWIDQLKVSLPQETIQENIEQTILPLAERIYDWYEYVTQPGFDIENPKWYGSHFYKTPIRHFDPGKTDFYKCDYWDYLVGDQEIDCLRPVKSFFTELENE